MKEQTRNIGLYWFRNDCRLTDMPALLALSKEVEYLLCVYVVDGEWFTANHWQCSRMGTARWRFICQGLTELNQQLQNLGNTLYVLEGNAGNIIKQLIQQYAISHFAYSGHCGVYEQADIQDIQSTFPTLTYMPCESTRLVDSSQLPFSIENMPDNFSTFRRKVEKSAHIGFIDNESTDIAMRSLPRLPPESIVPQGDLQRSLYFADSFTDNPNSQFVGGENVALKQLRYYLFDTDLVANYKQTRNGMLGWDFSTKLSAWLSAGHISPKTVYSELKSYEQQRQANESTYWVFFELLWRDFFHFHMLKYGRALFLFGGIRQKTPDTTFCQQKFERWTQGKTGYAIVDACMTELNCTGFMSNRGRQLVASCFVHELGLDWRYGAAYFEQQLIDFDVASNYGNWQYLAGVGCDPRGHRQFNLEKQAQHYDADGVFRRHWLGPNVTCD